MFFFLGGGAGLGFSRFRVQGLGFGGLVPLCFFFFFLGGGAGLGFSRFRVQGLGALSLCVFFFFLGGGGGVRV